MELSYEKPTPIQEKTLPIALKNRDIIGVSQSGTGKTCAFLLPILENIFQEKKKNNLPILRALILVPTRELAKQTINKIDEYGKYLDIKRTAIFGGVSKKDQIKKLENGVDIVVATTGRVIEHIKEKSIDLSSVQTIVIDELDVMLDLGFLEEIEKILPNIGKKRQIMMFSATLNQNVKKLAKEFLNDPVIIETSIQRSSVDTIEQEIILVDEIMKKELLSYLIGSRNYSQALVFVNMKKEADEIVENLNLDGLKAACIHGDIRQTARAKALRQFKSKELRVLVATDIAARGIDIIDLPVVINYALPQEITDYTHRIGRTGRAGKDGVAITLLSVKDYSFMKEIEKELILDIKRVELDDFKTKEKKPRPTKSRPKKLSEKKAGSRVKSASKNINSDKNRSNKFRKTSKRG